MVDNIKVSGSIYTKKEIVEYILDCAGYISNKDLKKIRVLEPSAGEGIFAMEIIERFFESIQDEKNLDYKNLYNLFAFYEIESKKISILKKNIMKTLQKIGIDKDISKKMVEHWVVNEDFLLANFSRGFDFIVGNPPYVRLENLDKEISQKYKNKFSTMIERADLYIPFIQKSLELLNSKGKLSFICSNRFLKNSYGKAIREFISSRYNIEYIIDIEQLQPFETSVSAYPCIFLFSSTQSQAPKIMKLNNLKYSTLEQSLNLLEGDVQNYSSKDISFFYKKTTLFDGGAWILTDNKSEKINKKIVDLGVPIVSPELQIEFGIGVATGANRVYIVDKDCPIENELLLPLVRKKDIVNGRINWQGKFVINPYKRDGGLIDLEKFPLAKRYFESHYEVLSKRSTVQKQPLNWYKTIDKITPDIQVLNKILIPDFKGNMDFIIDYGNYYPEHSLYFVFSKKVDIEVLNKILNSKLIEFQMILNSTPMRNGSLRYQSQYLKKIFLPSLEDKDFQNLKNINSKVEIDNYLGKCWNLTSEELSYILEKVGR